MVRTKFYWTQHFPAGKTIIIEHSYKPVTGQTFFTPSDLDPKAKSDRNWQQNYCMDGPTLAAIRQRMAQHKAAGQNDGTLNIYSTDFILTTANNWKGGIGKISPDHRQAEAEQHNLVVLERRPEEDGADPF